MISVVTYNLWGYGVPADYLQRRGIVRGAAPGSRAAHFGPPDSVVKKRRARLIETLGTADPDIVALQENARRPGFPDRSHARQLGRALGMSVVEGTFVPLIEPRGQPFEVGVALLSHIPIDETAEGDLPNAMAYRIGGSPRILQVRLDVDGGPLWVWVTHLPAQDPAANRACAESIASQAAGVSEPLLVCGDLNASPDAPAIRHLVGGEAPARFVDLWASIRPGEEGFTMANPDPTRRIDYILLRAASSPFHGETAELIGDGPDSDGLYPSDHCGVKVILET